MGNKFFEIYGEHGDMTPFRPPTMSRHAKFCMNCQVWVDYPDMKRFSSDGTYTHFLCPGCDADLADPELAE